MISARKQTYSSELGGNILNLFFRTYLLMLLIGGIHHEVSKSVPAVGYWGTMLLYVTVSFTAACLRAEHNDRKAVTA